MKEFLKNFLPLILLAGGIVSLVVLIQMRQDPPREERSALDPIVEVEPVSRHSGTMKIKVDGVATPFREITLSAEVGGRITFKSPSCQAGRFVTEGEKLLVIDPRNYQLQLDRLEQELRQAEAARAELEVEIANSSDLLGNSQQDLRLQRSELERQQQLGSATTRTQVEAAERAVLTSQNRIIELNNQIRLLESRRVRLDSSIALRKAEREQAALDLQRTEITAPVSGVVVSDLIEQDALAQPGTQLLTIEDTSAIEVKCSLQVDQLYWVWSQAGGQSTQHQPLGRYQLPPLPARVTYEAAGRVSQWQGQLSRYDGVGFDQRTRMVPCRVRVDNPSHVSFGNTSGQLTGGGSEPVVPALMRGMFVKVELSLPSTESLLSVDQRAIQPTGEVIVVEATGAGQAAPSVTPTSAAGRTAAAAGEDVAYQSGRARLVGVKVLYHENGRAVVAPTSGHLDDGARVAVTPLPGVSLFELREKGVEVRIAPTRAGKEVAREVAYPLGD